jgi:hypothetical protein
MTTGREQRNSPPATAATPATRAARTGTGELDPGALPATPGGLAIRRLTHYLQALEDAADHRRARASQPCNDCDPATGIRCQDHGRDIDLIAEYAQTHRLIDEAIATASASPSAQPGRTPRRRPPGGQ